MANLFNVYACAIVMQLKVTCSLAYEQHMRYTTSPRFASQTLSQNPDQIAVCIIGITPSTGSNKTVMNI
jgi:hypothetical protein